MPIAQNDTYSGLPGQPIPGEPGVSVAGEPLVQQQAAAWAVLAPIHAATYYYYNHDPRTAVPPRE